MDDSHDDNTSRHVMQIREKSLRYARQIVVSELCITIKFVYIHKLS